MAYFQGDFLEAHRLLEESVSIGREVGAAGKRDLANALALLGHVALLQGNPSTAKELAGEGLQVVPGGGGDVGHCHGAASPRQGNSGTG